MSKMRVLVLMHGDYSDACVVGVYSTREKLMQAREKALAQSAQRGPEYTYLRRDETWRIYPVDVDVEVPLDSEGNLDYDRVLKSETILSQTTTA